MAKVLAALLTLLVGCGGTVAGRPAPPDARGEDDAGETTERRQPWESVRGHRAEGDPQVNQSLGMPPEVRAATN